ncbi:MAG: hypothetical protein K6U74_06810 [Firmicutes bacterium]|nr:hypothetical protein [Bacillota bacterium]
MSKNTRAIRKLVQLLCRNHTPAIDAGSIADYLQCPVEVVEAELHRMVEEEILYHTYELHCCQCGYVMASSEDSSFLTGGGQVECPGCFSQTESITMNECSKYFRTFKS